jgi:hypothetical protein
MRDKSVLVMGDYEVGVYLVATIQLAKLLAPSDYDDTRRMLLISDGGGGARKLISRSEMEISEDFDAVAVRMTHSQSTFRLFALASKEIWRVLGNMKISLLTLISISITWRDVPQATQRANPL